MVDPTGLIELLPSGGIMGYGMSELLAPIKKNTYAANTTAEKLFNVVTALDKEENRWRSSSDQFSNIGGISSGGGFLSLISKISTPVTIGSGFIGVCSYGQSKSDAKTADNYESYSKQLNKFLYDTKGAETYQINAVQYQDSLGWKTNPQWTITALDKQGKEIQSTSFLFFYHPSGNPDVIFDFVLDKELSKSMDDSTIKKDKENIKYDDIKLPENQKDSGR
jgi:hypothetical protein